MQYKHRPGKDADRTNERYLLVTPISILGNISDVSLSGTAGWYQQKINIPQLVIEIEEDGLKTQRCHSLYKSKTKGYYCVICKRKCYFKESDILSLPERSYSEC